MTRKDYVLIAGVIAQLVQDIDEGSDSEYLTDRARAIRAGERDATITLARRLADRLRQDNPRFETKRFLTACGFDMD